MERLNFPIPQHVTVPSEFFCDECHFIKDPDGEAFQAWAKEFREDLAGSNAQIRCKCEQKRQLAIQMRQRMFLDANIPRRQDVIGPRTFDNFNEVDGTAEMVEAAKAFVAGELPEKVLLLVGVTGSGRSHILEAIGRAALAEGESVRYDRAEDLLNTLRHSHNSELGTDLFDTIQWYQKFAVLLIDDVGMQTSTPWGVGYLTNIVDHRYSYGLRLVVSTNCMTPEDMAAVWDWPLASRLMDTHSGVVRVIHCEAEDYRLSEWGKP